MKLLLVEDSVRLQKALREGLRRAGYSVDVSGDGNEALWYAENYQYDVIILDIMLPGIDGLEVLKRLRAKNNPVHILLLTAKDTIEDKVKGLQSGADDYLVKPFAFEELLARIQALCRRQYAFKSNIITIGTLEINLSTKTAKRAGNPIELQPREYALLEYLALRRWQVVFRSEIKEHIYDDYAEHISNVVDSAICNLRKKISVGDNTQLIFTRRGLGYIMDDKPPVE